MKKAAKPEVVKPSPKRLHLGINAIGLTESNGRTIAISYGLKKMVATSDQPLELLTQLLDIAATFCDYSSPDAMKADVEAFGLYVKQFVEKNIKKAEELKKAQESK